MRWWDVEPVAALEAQLFPGDAWTAETFWSELAHPESRHYVVADDGDRVVGYAGLMAVGSDGDVQTIGVAPSHRGQGLGDALLDALLAEAVDRGCDQVLLEVRAGNVAAQALYARAGFARIAVRRGYYQPGGEDAVVMRLRGPARRAARDGAAP